MNRKPDADARGARLAKGKAASAGRAAPKRASPRAVAHVPSPGERALQRAALAVSAASGPKAYQGLIAELADILGVDVAFVAVFDGAERARMRTLAAVLDSRPLRNFDYELAGSPCAQVVGRDFRFVAKGVAAEFPPDAIFRAKGMDCYAAYPLTGAAGAPLGLLVAMNRRTLADPALAESMLKIFAVRIAAEIERGRAEDALRRAALAVSGAEGRDVYRELVRVLATILDVEIAFIALPKAEDACTLRMLAFCIDGAIAGDFEYPMAGTPCEQVLRSGYRTYPDRLTERFPRDDDFRSIGAQSYAGLPLTGSDGAPIGIISVVSRKPLPNPELVESMLKIFAARACTEIERERAGAALQASEAQYRAIFNASADALVLWDSSSRRVDVNPAYERIYGFAREEVVGGDFEENRPLEYNERRRDLVRRTLAGERCAAELESMRKDGTRIDVEVRTIPIQHRGQPHVLAILRDITERKRTDEALRASEAQLRQAQKMEAIGQLTGGIAHDFNNILQSVVGYTVLAEERQHELRDPPLGRYLEQIHTATRRASDLIGQMLTFSRGQRGERRPLALAPLVQEATQMLRSTLPSTIALQTQCAARTPSVQLDPVQFEQVLINLGINARDAMRSSGKLLVAADVVEVRGAVCASCRKRVAGTFVELAVGDSGPGIPAAVAERMFEPFYTTKEVGKGSGMGLAMVHGIVHDHGGHILIDTAPGAGTTVRVLFQPLDSSAALPPEPDGRRPAPPRKPRLRGSVLVADDEAAVRELLRELLQGWGLDVVLASTGLEAAAAFAAAPRRFDLMLTDQTMPEMTGLALAREVTRQRPGLPVLLCTGFGDALSDQDTAAAGISAVARKPLTPADLYAILSRHLAVEP